MAGGRPTVATDENVAKSWKYLEDGWTVVPTVEGLAVVLGISKESLYARSEFSDVLAQLKVKQGDLLINGGLKGLYNSTIAKLLLSSKHGYVEKQETDITSKGEQVGQPVDKSLVDSFVEHVKQQTRVDE